MSATWFIGVSVKSPYFSPFKHVFVVSENTCRVNNKSGKSQGILKSVATLYQTSINKREKLQYRALRFVYNDFDYSYAELLTIRKNMSIQVYLKFMLLVEV